MNPSSQMLGGWAGVATIVIFGLSFIVPGFLPPLAPAMTAAEAAAYFQEHATSIRSGMILMMFAGSFNFFFVAAIATQLRRIETRQPFWTYAQIIAGCAGSTVIIIGAMLMTAAVFRPERPIEISYALFDLAWVMIIMPGTPALFQNLAIGGAVLNDRSAAPILPRWYGFFNLWTALLYSPGALITFFKAGPFAWNGLLTFWLPAAAFGSWFLLTFWLLRKVIREQPSG